MRDNEGWTTQTRSAWIDLLRCYDLAGVEYEIEGSALAMESCDYQYGHQCWSSASLVVECISADKISPEPPDSASKLVLTTLFQSDDWDEDASEQLGEER
jgi:hypothetical protein